MSEFEEVAKERLNFVGEETISHINGKKILYFSAAERTKRQRHSSTVITAMVLLVIACVGVIFYLKYYMVSSLLPWPPLWCPHSISLSL
jgi:magnesium-transporting ATPase (P-type)